MGPVHAGQGVRPKLGNRRQRVLQGNRLGRAARPRAPGIAWLRHLIAATALAAATTPAAWAGAWPRERGDGLIISSVLYDRAESYFDEDGQRRDGGYYEKQEYATYLEYGLTNRLTLVGRVAWQEVALLNAGVADAAKGFAASEAGARILVWQSDVAVASLQMSAVFPGGGENVADRPLGDGGSGAELRALIGRAIGQGAFVEAQTAYRWRDEGYQDEARLDLTAGWRPRPRYLVMLQSFSTWTVGDPSSGQRDISQHKIQASFGISTGRGDFHVGGYFTPAGRNAIDERAIFASWWQRF